VQILGSGDDAGGKHVAAQDAAKNIDEDGFDCRIAHKNAEAFLTCSAEAPPPTSRKFAASHQHT